MVLPKAALPEGSVFFALRNIFRDSPRSKNLSLEKIPLGHGLVGSLNLRIIINSYDTIYFLFNFLEKISELGVSKNISVTYTQLSF
jgi:hypothetical protein